MTKIELKDKIMLDALNGKIEYPAEMLSYVDLFWDLRLDPNVEIYFHDKKIAGFYEYLFNEDKLITVGNLIKIANNIPNTKCYYITSDTNEDIWEFITLANSLSKRESFNILPLTTVSDINPSGYYVMWLPRNITKPPIRFYSQYFLISGEGWGKLQGTEKALTTQPDKKLYNKWKKNIVEIEEHKKKVLQDYINSLKSKNVK